MNNVIGEQSVLLIDHNQQGNQCKLFPLIAIEHSTAHKRARTTTAVTEGHSWCNIIGYIMG